MPEELEESKPKEGVWQNPQVWLSVMATILSLLFTILIFIGNHLLNELSTISTNVQALNLSTTRDLSSHEARIKTLEEANRNSRNDLNNQTAYNYDLNRAMTTIITQLRDRGYTTPDVPVPPSPHK